MKAKNFRDMTVAELQIKLKDLKTELLNLRFSNATGQLGNPIQLNATKKDIARVQTIIRERELGLDKRPSKKA